MIHSTQYRLAALAGVTLAVLVPASLAGCGGNAGPERYDLSGAVTYGGKPVPAGMILFAPDVSQGNKGPGAMVEFVDGRYRTASGKGTVGGPHVIRIVGYDGKPSPGGESTAVKPLFTEYKLEIDLPREDATRDFDVPASHK